MAFLSAVPAQAEWFDKGSAAYRTLDGKWRRAAINVEPGKIEVFNRKDRTLVASFTSGSVEHGVNVRRRGKEGAISGVTGAATVGILYALAKTEEGVVVINVIIYLTNPPFHGTIESWISRLLTSKTRIPRVITLNPSVGRMAPCARIAA